MASGTNRSSAPECLPEADPEPSLPAQVPALVREHLGRELQSFYAAILAEEQPPQLLDLIAQLGAALSARDTSAASAFHSELIAALPGLRAFAHSLTANPSQAEDLVQETLLKAWANQDRFQPGSNFMAWVCTILRN
jgi:RNA polymerase sigma-70 factor (ECF subfamily)